MSEKLEVSGLTFELRPIALEKFRESMQLLDQDKDVMAHNDRILFHSTVRVTDEKGADLPLEWEPFFARLNLAHMRRLLNAVRRVNDLEEEEVLCPHCGRNVAEVSIKKNGLSSGSAPGLTGTPASTGRPSSSTGAPSIGAGPPKSGADTTRTGKWWQRR